MNVLEAILVSIVTALITSGLLVTVLRKYLLNLLDLKQYSSKKLIDYQDTQREIYLNSRFDAYPELSEICYRVKIVAEECLIEGDLPAHKVEKYGELVAQLTDRLFQYKLFISPGAWNMLHEIKHICQDLLVLLDILSRNDPIEIDGVREQVEARAKNISKTLSIKIDELDKLLREDINNITKICE